MKYAIGIDLGTSGVKAALLSQQGQIVGIRSAGYEPDFGSNGHVEQHPDVWWENTKTVLHKLMGDFPEAKGNVAALACSGQMHSSVFLDENMQVIRPAILWNDTRTTKQTKDIYAACGGEEKVLSYAYNRALEGFTLPKILWLRENEPDHFAKVRKIVMPKDYINFKLTGHLFTDVSDAAGTLLFDVKNRQWSKEILSAVGLSESLLPSAIESTALVGNVTAQMAEELGLSVDTQVMAGGADNSCAAIGNGVVAKGQAVVSVGTSGTVVAFLDGVQGEVTGDVHLFNYSYPQSCYAMGCMLAAGQCLNWLKNNILTNLSYDELNEAAVKAPVGSHGLTFLPYLFGERCPYSDADARGVFFGLSGTTDAGDMTRAVMEGVAFGLKDMFLLVEKFAQMDEIYMTGGGAKSPVWTQIIADVLGRRLTILNVEEGPALGAGLIACVGAGIFKDFTEAKETCTAVVKVIEPSAENHTKYNKLHPLFMKLYEANKVLFKLSSQMKQEI